MAILQHNDSAFEYFERILDSNPEKIEDFANALLKRLTPQQLAKLTADKSCAKSAPATLIVCPQISYLLDKSPQGHILLDNDYKVAYLNPMAQKLLTEIGNTTLTENIYLGDLCPKYFAQALLNTIEDCRDGKSDNKSICTINTPDRKNYLECSCSFWENKEDCFHISWLDLTEVYEKEDTLFLKNRMLASLYDSNVIYCIRTDLNGRYTYANRAFLIKFETTLKDIIGTPLLLTVHPDEIERCNEAVRNLFIDPDSVQNVEVRKPKPTGGYLPTVWEFAAIYNRNGEMVEIQCTGRDITNEGKDESELKQDLENLESIVKSGKLATWKWDIANGQVEYNKQWTEILGYSLTELDNSIEAWKDLLHPDDRGRVMEVLQNCIDGINDYYYIENRKRAKDGTWKWLIFSGKVSTWDAAGKAQCIIGVNQDITRHREIELTAQINDERNNAILTTMQGGIVVQDLEGTITYSNKSATQILGLSFEQMTGTKSVDKLWRCIRENGNPYPGEEHPAMEVLRTHNPITGSIMGVHKPDGTLTWISINAQLLNKPGTNEAYGVFTTFEEITERKNAQIKIKESEEFLRASLDASLEEIFLLEAIKNDNGELVDFSIKEVNANGIAQLLVPKEEAIGKQISTLNTVNNILGYIEKFKDVYQKQVACEHGYQIVEKPGMSISYYHQQILPLEKGVAIYNRNITDGRKAEAERSRLLVRLENLAEKSPGMIYEYCLQPNGKSYLPYCSHKSIDFFGVTPEQAALDANLLFKRIHKDDIEDMKLSIKESAKFRVDWKSNFRVLGEDNSTKWLEGSASPQRMDGGNIVWSGILLNITERKKMELELERLSLLAKKTTNAVIFTDARRKAIWANDGFTRMTGFTIEDIKGKRIADVLQSSKTDRKKILEMHKRLSNNQPVLVEVSNIAKNGRELWVSLEIQPLLEKGVIVGYMSIEQDITERKQREEEQKKLISQLSLTIEDLTQFSYIVSHNLRAPLANILGLTNFLINHREEKNILEFLGMLKASGESLDMVINDLNEILAIRNKTIEFSEVPLEGILNECTKLLDKAIEDSGATINHNFNGVVNVYSVKPYLLTIFYNLLSNALKYAQNDTPSIIDIEVWENENAVYYKFTDNGIGIDLNRYSKHIFGLYQRLSNVKEGKGLGLYLTKTIIKTLGGTIKVTSVVNEGATFTISLPKHSHLGNI